MVPGRARRRSLIQAAGAAALGALLPARDASARPLAPDEIHRLSRGEIVRIPLDMDLARGDYFGGLAYGLIPAPAAEVRAALNDPSAYKSILPMTLEAKVIGEKGDARQLFLKQGGRLGTASYVLLVRSESPSLIRFWLDPDEPHEVADLWGFFRVEPWTRKSSILTYAALLHLDFGMVKMLFSEKIRNVALGTPAVVRRYLARRGVGGR